MELFKTHLDQFFLWIFLLVLLPLLMGCPKKPPAEAENLHERANEAIENCASIYAKDQLLKLDVMLLEVEELKKKKKFKKMREKALEIIPHIEMLEQTIQKEKSLLMEQIDREKERAGINMRSALEEGALDHASHLLIKAKNLFYKGEEYLGGSGCELFKSLSFFYSSAQAAEMAKIRAVEENNRLEEERLARKSQEEKKVEVREQPKVEITQWSVAKGENLWTISSEKEVYGNPLLWPLIFWANRSQIKDPHLIYVDQILKIPRDLQKEEVEKALKIARADRDASDGS